MKKTKLYKNAATTNDEQSIKIRKCDVDAIVIKKRKRTRKDIFLMILTGFGAVALVLFICFVAMGIWVFIKIIIIAMKDF